MVNQEIAAIADQVKNRERQEGNEIKKRKRQKIGECLHATKIVEMRNEISLWRLGHLAGFLLTLESNPLYL
jgi:hypothetical protein